MQNRWKQWITGVCAAVLACGGTAQAETAAVPQKYVVACVGDSITEGIGATSSVLYSYPAQLQNMLGARYEVHNCGAGGTTLLKQGDYSYRKQSRYRESRVCNPDIVIIMLGTNDSKPQNWNKKAQFLPDLVELIQVYQNLESKPRVYVATSATVPISLAGITDEVVTGEVVPLQKEAARQTGCEVIDINALTKGHADWFCDGVHPDNNGYTHLANAFADVLSKRYDPQITGQLIARLDALPANPGPAYAAQVDALSYAFDQLSDRQAALITPQQRERLAAAERSVKQATAPPTVPPTKPAPPVTKAPTTGSVASPTGSSPSVTKAPTTTGQKTDTTVSTNTVTDPSESAASAPTTGVIDTQAPEGAGTGWWWIPVVLLAAVAGIVTGVLLWRRRTSIKG